jgi:exonuclease III
LSTTEQIGSDQPVGNPLCIPKPNEWTRIMVQNTNGVSIGREGDLVLVLDQIKQMEIDVMLITETNLDTNNHKVKARIHKDLTKTFGLGAYHVVTAASAHQYNGFYKPGGVMGIVCGKTKGRIIASGSDHMGRWVYIRLQGQGERVITIVGTYQVCQSNVKTVGPTTAIAQQYSILVQEGRVDAHQVRKHHAQDLLQFVKARQDKGDLVCVCGDFNETIGLSAQGLTRLCSERMLQDVVFESHGHGYHEFNTYKRGNKCIDYMLVDRSLMQATRASGYEPFNARIMGDHRGVYVDFHTCQLFGSDTLPLPPIALRDYQSKNIHQTAIFIQEQFQHLDDHQWLSQIQELQQCITNNTPNHELANKLDRRRIAACQYAGGKLKRYGPTPYSPALI